MLRRLGLGSLLVAGAISLTLMNNVVGFVFAVCVLIAPGVLATLLNELPIHDE